MGIYLVSKKVIVLVMGLVWIKIPGDTDLLDACNRAYESILREITNIAYISILHVIHQ
jgi:hypothetical protein